MRVKIKEKKSSIKNNTLKNMLKNPGLYFNKDSDFYVLSIAPCDGEDDCTLIYISPYGDMIETLDLAAWAEDTFVLSRSSIKIKND